MIKRLRVTAGLTVVIGLLAACGGTDEDSTDRDAGDEVVVETNSTDTTPETDPPATDPPVTDPPVTDPPATDAPVTDPPVTEPSAPNTPEWASGSTVTVQADTGPLELPVELAPFCESSRSFYVAANGIGFVGEGQVGTAQQLFAALAVLAPLTIETAPSDEFATEPTAARDQLAVIIPAFEEIGYDGDRISELSDPQSVLAALQGFAETTDGLRSFLIDACGADGEALDAQSRDAASLAAEGAGEVTEPTEPVEAVAGSPIVNAASSIMLSVPADWIETEESVESDRDQLVASSDIETFYGLITPGVLVLRGEGGLRDGGYVGRVLDFESDLEEAGCVLIDETGYDDGIYQGQERTFDCGPEDLDFRLLGGTTSDEALYAMVFLVHPSDQPGIRQLIVDTFEVA